MQVTQVFTPKPFSPIKLEITIESPEELSALHTLCRADNIVGSDDAIDDEEPSLVKLKLVIDSLYNDDLVARVASYETAGL